jgi:hypothetical protein
MKFALFILASWTEKDATHQSRIYGEALEQGRVPVGLRDDVTITPPPQNRADRLPCTRLKQSTYPKRRPVAVNLTVARVVNQPQIDKVIRAPVLLWNHMMHMKSLAIIQVMVTDGAMTLLSLGQLPSTTGCHVRLCPSLSPVVL